MSRPGPAPGPLGRPAPRAARVLRAPTRRVSARRNCSDVKSRVPYTLGHTGGPRLSRPGPAPDPAWTSRAEGGAGTSRADAPRIAPAELFRREIARPLHPRPHGRAALVAAGPCAGSAWTSRAEGGAGTSRADAPRIGPAELFRREIPRPLHPRPHGRAALVAAGPCAALDQHPTHGQIHSLPPTARRAKSPSRPRRVASVRASHVGWP